MAAMTIKKSTPQIDVPVTEIDEGAYLIDRRGNPHEVTSVSPRRNVVVLTINNRAYPFPKSAHVRTYAS